MGNAECMVDGQSQVEEAAESRVNDVGARERPGRLLTLQLPPTYHEMISKIKTFDHTCPHQFSTVFLRKFSSNQLQRSPKMAIQRYTMFKVAPENQEKMIEAYNKLASDNKKVCRECLIPTSGWIRD